jgi:hypothetical protein
MMLELLLINREYIGIQASEESDLKYERSWQKYVMQTAV